MAKKSVPAAMPSFFSRAASTTVTGRTPSEPKLQNIGPPKTETGKKVSKAIADSMPKLNIDTAAVEKKIGANPLSRRYTIHVNPSTFRPAEMDPDWVSTGQMACRRDHLSIVPPNFDRVPRNQATKPTETEKFREMLKMLGRTRPTPFTRVLTVPVVYEPEYPPNVFLEPTLGLYLSKTRYVYVDQALGPPPKTVFVPDIPDTDRINFVADSDQPDDVGLLVAAFDLSPIYGHIASLARNKFMDEARLLAHFAALVEMPTPGENKKLANIYNRFTKKLAELPKGQFGSALESALALFDDDEADPFEPFLAVAKKILP